MMFDDDLEVCLAYVILKRLRREDTDDDESEKEDEKSSSKKLVKEHKVKKVANDKNKIKRRYWVHPRNEKRLTEGEFHVKFQELRSHPEKFRDYYKMSIPCFDELLDKLRDRIKKEDTILRTAISPEERLTVTLRYLTTGCSFGSLTADFKMGHNTARNAVREVCIVLWDVLQPTEMPTLKSEDWKKISSAFYSLSYFPNCVGCIDGKLIPHGVGHADLNPIVLLGVCDADYCFTMVDVGLYDEEGDWNIFKESTLGKSIINCTLDFPHNQLFPGDYNGIEQPFFFIGSESFPLRDNLIRPFPTKKITKEEKIFNHRLSIAKRNIDGTFGLLSNKWAVLQNRFLIVPEFAIVIVKACCMLHNFVRRRDGIDFNDTTSCSLESLPPTHARNLKKAVQLRSHLLHYVNYKNKLANEIKIEDEGTANDD